MLNTMNERTRADLTAAAAGIRRTSPERVPQGIRVTVGPAASPPPGRVAPTRRSSASPATLPSEPAEPTPSTEPVEPEPESMPETMPELATELAPAGGDLAELLAEAARSDWPPVRDLAARIAVLLAELRQALATEAVASAVRCRVAQLRAELAAAEAELEAAEAGHPAPAPAAVKRPVPTAAEVYAEPVDAQAVRAWAAATRRECKPTGRLPQRLIEAYRLAVAAGITAPTSDGGPSDV